MGYSLIIPRHTEISLTWNCWIFYQCKCSFQCGTRADFYFNLYCVIWCQHCKQSWFLNRAPCIGLDIFFHECNSSCQLFYIWQRKITLKEIHVKSPDKLSVVSLDYLCLYIHWPIITTWASVGPMQLVLPGTFSMCAGVYTTPKPLLSGNGTTYFNEPV